MLPIGLPVVSYEPESPPSPTQTHGVRSLFGVTGFLHSFVPNYSQVTTPLTDLLKGTPNKKKQEVAIDWTPQHQNVKFYIFVI
ncbi:hypothetical protein GNI_054580 [Gregarina niphandrodes]|uniref:Uncharacterized protein n=1 Tax=Gregarina niphandrodes TaxID=110365 RepID=A0A023B900_GRENI|nr:hypothetical protein GNI_054580 [Gregarina niphandrodes]EZG70705.1 hypothetical protein GNI_054580 [Gregarina niphandrodes]|eukprot:XP_011129888.1 hypothetical protein GNI_054580 [Gregarina niphandrodes]